MTQYRKITEKLYQCLTDNDDCKFRVPFGFKVFCSWLLRGEENQTPNNFPCEKEPSDERRDG